MHAADPFFLFNNWPKFTLSNYRASPSALAAEEEEAAARTRPRSAPTTCSTTGPPSKSARTTPSPAGSASSRGRDVSYFTYYIVHYNFLHVHMHCVALWRRSEKFHGIISCLSRTCNMLNSLKKNLKTWFFFKKTLHFPRQPPCAPAACARSRGCAATARAAARGAPARRSSTPPSSPRPTS